MNCWKNFMRAIATQKSLLRLRPGMRIREQGARIICWMQAAKKPFNSPKQIAGIKGKTDHCRSSAIETSRSTYLLQKISRIAAILTGLALLGTGEYYYFIKPRQPQQQARQTSPKPPDHTIHYNRYITLPDGSTVILHAGSKLDYPVSFNGNTREVNLIGEGYFDVQHDPARPFIIHTGHLKTTVLGTAFNIKANAGEKTSSYR